MANKAWVVAVDMGYGHQRAAYPLRHLSPTGKVVLANNYEGIPRSDYRLWHGGQSVYELLSRSKNIPVVGDCIFGFLDYFQRVPSFYPRRDLTKPTLQLTTTYRTIRRGWGREFINYLNQEDLPLISTFFTPAFMAEEHGFKNEIYVVICDSDISRAWAPLNPRKSRIKYLAPSSRVVERLQLYGVKKERIFLTGFPLPEENIGGEQLKVLKNDLAERIINLDPEHNYRSKYAKLLKDYLRSSQLSERHTHPLTLTFAVGGAGAQKYVAIQIVKSLRNKLAGEEIKLNLIAGARSDVHRFFHSIVKANGLENKLGKNLRIISAVTKEDYFNLFNDILRHTDVLWTKPSELVFYSALGLPIIMAPSLGSQEVSNRLWLKTIGAGISQGDPRYTHEWLFDWVNSGWLAEAAMAGFLDSRQFGVKNIKQVVFEGAADPAKDKFLM